MADTQSIFIDMHGACLRAFSTDAGWIANLAQGYRWFVCEDDGRDAFTLSIEVTDHPAPSREVPRTWSGDLMEGGAAHIHEDERTWLLDVVGLGHVEIDFEARTADMQVRPGAFERFRFTPLSAVIEATLATQGQRLVHGACLGLPDGRSNILICAPSGFGKTTTTLVLVQSGFAFYADDASVVMPLESGWRAWGVPNEMKIHRDTAALLPWIGDLPETWNHEGEQAVHTDNFTDKFEVVKRPPRPLAAIVLLGQRTGAGHSLEAISRSDALIRIVRDNVSNSPTGVKPWNQSQFMLYSQMVRDTPTFELRVGTDLTTLAETLERALSERAVAAQ
ncbi:hypothetical protein ACKTEK_04605 [Tepidamorphus sp. 3E244]|uniref:hypothetical protein n=1 Tax=Tepidamorphus sp. 3E244 TaxID=3385498 RepID=UPI0038FBF794